MSDATTTDQLSPSGAVLAADGTPLKKSLNRALRRQKLRALMLIAPLLLFVVITFIAPIADMLFRSVENQIVSETLPRTVVALDQWDDKTNAPPSEDVFRALYRDMFIAAEKKEHTRVGQRLNYETTGISSLFRKSGRKLDDMAAPYEDLILDVDKGWKAPDRWATLYDTAGGTLPAFSDAYAAFVDAMAEDDKDPAKTKPWELFYSELYTDIASGDAAKYTGPLSAELAAITDAAQGFTPPSLAAAFEEVDEDWADPEVWGTIKVYAPKFTPGYFLTSVDMQLGAHGVEQQPDEQRIYLTLFKRTFIMSMAITLSCIALGYPIAWLLANLPMRVSNLLLILVLLPFWTSLLVRTSAWKVLLQQQGVINDLLVWIGLLSESGRLVMINNATGTVIAMTHILLPFMILPLYSVMQTIQPTYLRAAKSLGATNWTAFWRVYFPQSIPGIGAGSILVFILSIGYYITPEIVGGTKGVFISNRIAYHISSSLNWGLAAALGTILLAVVMLLYWAYDKIVGIDNVKLG